MSWLVCIEGGNKPRMHAPIRPIHTVLRGELAHDCDAEGGALVSTWRSEATPRPLHLQRAHKETIKRYTSWVKNFITKAITKWTQIARALIRLRSTQASTGRHCVEWPWPHGASVHGVCRPLVECLFLRSPAPTSRPNCQQDHWDQILRPSRRESSTVL